MTVSGAAAATTMKTMPTGPRWPRSCRACDVDEVVEGVADGFFWLWFGGVGTDHASGFTAGPDDVAVFGGAVVDDFFEPVEDLFAGESGVLAVKFLEFSEVFLCVFALEDATCVSRSALEGAVVSGVEPGLAQVPRDVVAVEEVFLAGV